MEKKIPPLWEVKEIYQGKQVLSYGFHVETEQGSKLRKRLSSRKVDKCGIVFRVGHFRADHDQ